MPNTAEHYRSIFDTSIDAIFVIDERGLIKEVNTAGLELFGYSSNELIGNNVSMLMGEPHHSRHNGYLERYQKTGEARIIGIGREVMALRKDGVEFPIRLAVSEFTDTDGRTCYTGVIHDMTEEHSIRAKLQEYNQKLEEMVKERTHDLQQEIHLKEEAEAALRTSQILYEAIAQNFPNGIITVLNRDLNIVFIDGSELRNSGYRMDKLQGLNYAELLPRSIREACIEKFKAALNGENSVFELEHDHNIYLARTVPLHEVAGQVEQILHVEINITAQKKAEEEIYKALTKEKELNELKSKFVSMASHEFRTPLSGIQSSAALIDRYVSAEDQEKRSKHVKKIRSNVQNLNMILNDFLSLEKIEGGLIRNKPQVVDLTEFLNEVLEETSMLKKAGQQVKADLRHRQEPYELDPFLLRNILNNLLSNAYKYSGEDGEIILSSRSEPRLSISVKDSGIGISNDDQKLLFNRFFRASNATNIQGTGLGLNIVRRYAEIMGAEVSFESELNKGSIFTIEF